METNERGMLDIERYDFVGSNQSEIGTEAARWVVTVYPHDSP